MDGSFALAIMVAFALALLSTGSIILACLVRFLPRFRFLLIAGLAILLTMGVMWAMVAWASSTAGDPIGSTSGILVVKDLLWLLYLLGAGASVFIARWVFKKKVSGFRAFGRWVVLLVASVNGLFLFSAGLLICWMTYRTPAF